MSLFIYKCTPLLRTCLPTLQLQHLASLYAPSSLGIDRYLETRNKIAGQFINFSQKYREKMNEFVQENDKNIIFTDDLKNMIHLSTKDDAELMEKMIRKFNQQRNELRFGNFIFGPVVMRMYYYLDMPDEAFKLFTDEETYDFFDQLVSQQIMMDLLYKHEKYDEVIKVFETIEKNRKNYSKYSKNVINLLMATCYKQNNKESLEYAKKVWRKLLDLGHEPMRRGVTFFAGLAINQGEPHIALELLSSLPMQKYVTVVNLKTMAFADLDRVDDALPVLRSLLDVDNPNFNTSIVEETMEKVKLAIARSSNKAHEREFSQIQKGLTDRNFIKSESIDSMLCREIIYVHQSQNTDVRVPHSYKSRQSDNRTKRPGLQDMI